MYSEVVEVPRWKVLPLEPEEECHVRVRVGRGGSYRIMRDGGIGVSIWKDIANSVIRNRPNRIMLVGATDTGKSTLATYLSNTAIANGLSVSIVDGDVGQADLAPPGCVGASTIERQFLDLRNVGAQHYGFIGDTSPRKVMRLVIESIIDIMKKLPVTDVCIINTDGYMDEYGIDYKIQLIKMLKPDLIACLGNLQNGERLLDEFKDAIVRVGAPAHVSKTRYERERRRLFQYGRFLGNARHVTFDLNSKRFWLAGRSFNIFHMNGKIQIGSMKIFARVLNGMFVGLSRLEDVKGFGIITGVSDVMTVRTPYNGEFDTILLSTIRLSRDMRREYKIPIL
jgi:polynucleotide 5'-hydroxyl-kinase GRC3/NOL9